MAQVNEKLINDHAALDKVLKQLQMALRSANLELAHNKLDLFWARLAVHIRAEHLHFFPTVLGTLENAARHASAPSLDEAQSLVDELHQDHDFFMKQLIIAVGIMRELSTSPSQLIVPQALSDVQNIVFAVERRLVNHNEIEESQIYSWATKLLSPDEQTKLAGQVATELLKHPPRFTLSTWLDK